MTEYEKLRHRYKPAHITLLLIAESQPPAADTASSRHFYRSDSPRRDDRLFTNTIKALYPEAAEQTETQIQEQKEAWLRRFQADGRYMIEALDESLPHEVTKEQRQQLIQMNLPALLKKVGQLADAKTGIVLIKSNVFAVAAGPLKAAGYKVLNTELVDYPGRFNQPAYRKKLQSLAAQVS